MYILYQHVNKANGKVYIGITKRQPSQRWRNGNGYKSSPYFYSAILKYGWNNFEHNIILRNLSKQEACAKQQQYIKMYHSDDRQYGYNSTSGGQMFEMNQQTKQKIASALIGNKNGLGKQCSEQKRRKISEAQKGSTFSDQHKAKLSEAAKKRHVPCSEQKKNKLSSNYPHKRKVYCKQLNVVFDSVQQCGKQLGIPPTCISKICKGNGQTYKGYHFYYYNDTINA